MKKCAIEICDRPARCLGLCNSHYERRRTGSPIPDEIPIGGRIKQPRSVVLRRYYDTHREELLEKCRQQNKTNGTKRKEWKFLQRYNITLADYEKILDKQGGVCAICHKLPLHNGRNSKLHVDHDHKNGRVRGLLCMRCNIGLGYVEDTEYLLMANLYLKYAPVLK